MYAVQLWGLFSRTFAFNERGGVVCAELCLLGAAGSVLPLDDFCCLSLLCTLLLAVQGDSKMSIAVNLEKHARFSIAKC